MFALPLLADKLCRGYYSDHLAASRPSIVNNLRSRLIIHFKTAWFNNRPGTDAALAVNLMNNLEQYGRDVDLKIMDAFLKVLESTHSHKFAKKLGQYQDSRSDGRARANFFQPSHFDWTQLNQYFFESPLYIANIKEQDLNYLNHIVQTARSFAAKESLASVLERADDLWVRSDLKRNPELRSQYDAYVQNLSYQTLFNRFQKKIASWNYHEADFSSQMEFAIIFFANRRSKLDLFILERYLDLAFKFKMAPFYAHQTIASTVQLTDWAIFKEGLQYPSPRFLTDFLFQNSHSNQTKMYLLKILNQMDPMTDYALKNYLLFPDLYLMAKEQVDIAIEKQPAPEHFSSDTYYYTFAETKAARYKPRFDDRVKVDWNPITGQLHATASNTPGLYEKGFRYLKDFKVGDNPDLKKFINGYFEMQRQRAKKKEGKSTLKLEEIDFDEKQELDANLMESAYIVEVKPGTQVVRTMIRVYDATKTKSYIEDEFPHITLPERLTGEPVFEIGRLMATEETSGNSLEYVMAKVAEYFKVKGTKGAVYLDASAAAVKYYKKFGAIEVFTPEQLHIPSHKTPLWVLRFSVDDIIRIFSKPEYSNVPLRKSE